jgi:hypothetical protein
MKFKGFVKCIAEAYEIIEGAISTSHFTEQALYMANERIKLAVGLSRTAMRLFGSARPDNTFSMFVKVGSLISSEGSVKAGREFEIAHHAIPVMAPIQTTYDFFFVAADRYPRSRND